MYETKTSYRKLVITDQNQISAFYFCKYQRCTHIHLSLNHVYGPQNKNATKIKNTPNQNKKNTPECMLVGVREHA